MNMNYLKSINAEDRKAVDKIYKSFGELSLSSLELEIDYSEKREADLISKIFASWNIIKPEFRLIFSNMKNPGIVAKKEKSYFG